MPAFNPVNDFLHGARGVAGLLGQVEAQRARTESLQMQREHYRKADDIAERKQHMVEVEEQRKSFVRELEGQSIAAWQQSMRPDGTHDMAAYNKALRDNLASSTALNQIVQLSHPGAKFGGFVPVPGDPSKSYAVAILPNGERDILGDEGDEGEALLFPTDPENGPADWGFRQLARIAPKVADSVITNSVTEAQARARSQGLANTYAPLFGEGDSAATPPVTAPATASGSVPAPAPTGSAAPGLAGATATIQPSVPQGQNVPAQTTTAAADVPDYSDKFNTPLAAEEERRFQSWRKSLPSPLQNMRDYDLRGAWKAGAQQAANGHLPDRFKKPNHPTFSSESKYNGVDGAEGGQWVQDEDGQWSFRPGKTNLQLYGTEGLQDYFQRAEPDSVLALPGPQQPATTGLSGALSASATAQPPAPQGQSLPTPAVTAPATAPQGLVQPTADLQPTAAQPMTPQGARQPSPVSADEPIASSVNPEVKAGVEKLFAELPADQVYAKLDQTARTIPLRASVNAALRDLGKPLLGEQQVEPDAANVVQQSPTRPSLSDALSPVSSASAAESPSQSSQGTADAPLTARSAGQATRRGFDAAGNFAYNYLGQGLMDQAWRGLVDKGGRFISGFVDPKGPAQQPVTPNDSGSGSKATQAPTSLWDDSQTQTQAQTQTVSDTSKPSSSDQNRARLEGARLERAVPKAKAAVRAGLKELREGHITPEDFKELLNYLKAASPEVDKWLTSKDETIAYGMSKSGKTIAVRPLGGLTDGTSGGQSQKDRLKYAQDVLNLKQDIATSVAPEDKRMQGFIVGSMDYLFDQGLSDPANPNNVELMRKTTAMLGSAVDQGAKDFTWTFNTRDDIRPSDHLKAVLAMQAGYTDYRRFKKEILDPVGTYAQKAARANPKADVDAGISSKTGTAALGQLMRAHGMSHDQAVAAFQQELEKDPRFLSALTHLSPIDVADRLAKKYGGKP